MKVVLWLAAVAVFVLAGCSSSPARTSHAAPGHGTSRTPIPAPTHSPLTAWLAKTPLEIAHRGGDADWVEGTADAYRNAAGWNPRLALEVPAWLTADGVWVISEDSTTGRVFGTDDDIRTSTWATLSKLRTTVGGFPMARLVDDILVPYGSTRILFIDNKSDLNVAAFFDLLDSYAGNTRYVIKGYYRSANTAAEARLRGYTTWGYYYAQDMPNFASTQSRFNLLGLNFTASGADFATMMATGKPIIAHLIATAAAASSGLSKGATGLMVSGVEQVVPRSSP